MSNTRIMPASRIAADTHDGRWMVKCRPGTRRSDVFKASELAAMNDGEFVIWESAGHIYDGRELYVRSRFVPLSDGSLAGYDANGRLNIIHPADRALRILTK